MFVKRDEIKEFLVPGDMAPIQSTQPTDEASMLANGGNCMLLNMQLEQLPHILEIATQYVLMLLLLVSH
jgi:hypothetical protein